MICPDCGTENKERAAFCVRCGRPIWPPPQVAPDSVATPLTQKPVTPQQVWDEELPEVVVKPPRPPTGEEAGPADDRHLTDPEVIMELARARATEEQQSADRTRSWALMLGLAAFLIGIALTFILNQRHTAPRPPGPAVAPAAATTEEPEVAIYDVRFAHGVDQMGQPDRLSSSFPTDGPPPVCFLTYKVLHGGRSMLLQVRFVHQGREMGQRTLDVLDPSKEETHFELRWPTGTPEVGDWLVEFSVGAEKLASESVALTASAAGGATRTP